MKINVIKIKLRKLHKYIGFTFSVFILHLTITGILLTYPDTFKIKDKYTSNGYLLKKYNMQTPQDVLAINDSKHELIAINNSLYLNKKFIDSNTENMLGVIYDDINELLYVLDKEEIIIYVFEKINNILEINDIKYISNSKNFIQLGKDKKDNIYLKSSKNLYIFYKETAYKEVKGLLNNEIIWSKTIKATKNTSEFYLRIHQGDGVSILKILTELHNGKIFGSIFTFILFISSVSLIFLTLSSFIFGTNFFKNKKKLRKDFS